MALQAHGTEVEILNALETHPDCCFVEDCAVMIDGVALISNLGAPSRRGEEEAVADYLSEDSNILRMPKGATLDGGDVVFFDDRYLIGVSTRTNQAGADFLTEQVREEGFDVELIDIPSSTLHLTTVCSSPREGTLLAAEGHLTTTQIGHLAEEILWVPNSDSYAANTIGYSGDRVIIADGYAPTRQVMLDAGFSITTVDMDAIRQADGSLTCLSVFNR
jgi:dimethylargininase